MAAIRAGRHSVGNEVDPVYLRASADRVRQEASALRYAGPAIVEALVEGRAA